MGITPTIELKKAHYLLISLVILIACMGLVWLDKDTHGLGDLFRARMLRALVIYGIPGFFVCRSVMYHYRPKYGALKSIGLSLVIGIPITFLSIIVFFYFLRIVGIINTF